MGLADPSIDTEVDPLVVGGCRNEMVGEKPSRAGSPS